MMTRSTIAILLAGAALLGLGTAACVDQSQNLLPNPFLTFTEQVLGATVGGNTNSGDGGDGVGGVAGSAFRSQQLIQLGNISGFADLNVNLVAWIGANSVRAADQVDALINSGYVQLSRSVTLGVITLAPGTFVFNGPGLAGATPIKLAPGGTRAINLITPDRILLFTAPPTSCESIAFYYTIDDEPIDSFNRPDPEGALFGGATSDFGRKTLAQVDVYQCDPFAPGLFLQTGGGQKDPNEYFEGEPVFATFRLAVPSPDQPAAFIGIGEPPNVPAAPTGNANTGGGGGANANANSGDGGNDNQNGTGNENQNAGNPNANSP